VGVGSVTKSCASTDQGHQYKNVYPSGKPREEY